jgi:PIN domain nuclease of toxin-antitoxin system
MKAKKHNQPLIALVTDSHAVLRKQGFVATTIDPLHAIRSGLLPLHHRDPFDRLLAAQSLELDSPLVIADTIFDLYGVQRIW